MYTLKDVKDKLIDHLMEIDLASLDTCDLSGYTSIICQLSGLDRPDYMESLTKMMAETYKKPEKEETDNA